jgi:hypothetical protein
MNAFLSTAPFLQAQALRTVTDPAMAGSVAQAIPDAAAAITAVTCSTAVLSSAMSKGLWRMLVCGEGSVREK